MMSAFVSFFGVSSRSRELSGYSTAKQLFHLLLLLIAVAKIRLTAAKVKKFSNESAKHATSEGN